MRLKSIRGRSVLSRSRRLLGWALVLMFTQIISHPLLADQSPPRSVRIGLIGIATAEMIPRALSAFREELRSLGYVEGRNLVIEARWANGDASRLAHLANDLVRNNVDILVATTTYDVRAAMSATSTIPIVMVTSADPVATGLVADLARPDGNVTGLSLMTIELSTKRLQILKDTIPRLGRVAVLWNPDHPFHPNVVEGIKAVAPSLSLQPVFVSAQTSEQLPLAFVSAKRARAQALYVIEDPFFYLSRSTLSQLAAKEALPTIYGAKEYAEVGGFMSYGPNYEDLWRRAAGYVDKILRGARPSDLPIEQPTKFELIVNLKAAKELRLSITESTLLQATEVIK